MIKKLFRLFIITFLLIGNSIQVDEQNELPPSLESGFIRSLSFLHQNIKPPMTLNVKSGFNIMIEYITQNLDHFNPATGSWHMRYMSNGEFHIPNGPIFIFVGGEGEIHDGFLRGGILYDMAKEHSGYLFTTEHRFYGKSIPTADLSLQNLKYLTSYQALADLAHFIRTKKAQPEFANSKVILASGSYPGALTVWFQHLYPDLVHGSWASSAPINAKVDFPEYKEVVGQAIRTIGGEACFNRFYYGIKKLEEYVETKRASELKSIMKICDNFDVNNWLDVGALFSSISNIAAGLVQNHNRGDIERDCQQILSGVDDVTGIATWYNSKLGPSQCYDYTFPATVAHMKYTQVTDSIWRQWTYLLCNEFGFSQTSKSYYQPFGTKFPVEFYEHICFDVFGVEKNQFWKNVEVTNNYYGGLNPNITNVYYSHGGIDPWYPAGMQVNDDFTSALIPLYAHCKDFDSISGSDSVEMQASKAKLQAYVRKWLN